MTSLHPLVMSGEQCPQLSSLTTIELGGRPQYYAKVTREAEAIEVLKWAKEQQLKVRVVGGGSNIVVDDDGLQGLVLQLSIEDIEWGDHQSANREQHVTISAGVVWSKFVEESVARELSGVECLVGIPGWAGAAPIQNIGAYGQSLSDRCIEVKVFDLDNESIRTLQADECDFTYRDSLFKRSMGRYVVLSLTLSLTRGGLPTINYPQLSERIKRELGGSSPRLIDVCESVKRIRAEKSMLWREDDPNRRSVGSFFTNPIITQERALSLVKQCRLLGLADPPQWPSEDGRVKIPAAWLIEQSGIKKGEEHNGVGVSSKHCLALINHGNGSYGALIRFARMIQQKVWSTLRVWLSPEAQVLTDNGQVPLKTSPVIALATCRVLPEWEVDDHPLWKELSMRGVTLLHPSWDDELFDWSLCDLVIPRTTWDYQGRWSDFLAWMERVDHQTHLLNPLAIMKWNIDKHYLQDLNISQPPSIWLDQRVINQQEDVSSLANEVLSQCSERGWKRAFLKPTIGASAIGTLRFDPLNDQNHPQYQEMRDKLEAHLTEWITKRSLILQPYVKEVEERGECSLIYFNGEFSHAVRKVPVLGDYRVQDDYGASDMSWIAPQLWRERCDQLLSELSPTPLYARCDFLTGTDEEPWLIELELIEPSLFFRHDKDSPNRFAEAILKRLDEVWSQD